MASAATANLEARRNAGAGRAANTAIHSNDMRSISSYKVIVLGRQGVGKTSLISRYNYHSFHNSYTPTVGVDFVSRALQLDGQVVKLQLWDTAGQERFNALISSYLRDSCAAVVVYDVSDRKSFEDVVKWVKEVKDQKGNVDTVLVLVGNKTDLATREVTKDDGLAMCKQLDMTFFGETSAKTNDGVDAMFRNVALAVLPQMPRAAKGYVIQSDDAAEGESTCQC
eukprot:GEMP01027092.1.p1 GENE.GEMP01027092.1~~GEMP01027092.1.p1  ORF type:complete len:225 (+),score=41.76 GEMP01027092.1:360-1034(+)